MKNIIKFLVSLFIVFTVNSCKESDNIIDDVLNYETGAVLRTISVNSNTLNSSKPESFWSVTVEEQDQEGGALLKSVGVYASIKDLTPENGTTVASGIFIKTIDASAFTTGPLDLPRATITATFGESVSAMGLTPDDYAPGDLFIFELRLELTDGRIFGASSAAGIITGGFFKSPFKYNAILLCSPAPGVYTVVMHDSFGDGWQTNGGNGGNGIQVTIDGVITEIGMCTAYEASPYVCTDPGNLTGGGPQNDATTTVTIPVGAEQATWNFPGDQYGEIAFEVYGPNDELLLAVGFGEGTPGLLPITLCAQ